MLLTVTHALWLSRSLENAYDCLEHKISGKASDKDRKLMLAVIKQQEAQLYAMLKEATLQNGRLYSHH